MIQLLAMLIVTVIVIVIVIVALYQLSCAKKNNGQILDLKLSLKNPLNIKGRF